MIFKSSIFLMGLATCLSQLAPRHFIFSSFKAKTKGGFLHFATKMTQFQPGIYDAELKIVGEKKFKLRIKERGTDSSEISFLKKSHDDFYIPLDESFTIVGSQVGQNFDIQGSIATDFSSSQSERTIETYNTSRVVRKCIEVKSRAINFWH